MTNEERVISLVGFAPDNKNATLGALMDRGVDPAGIYDTSNIVLLKRAAIEIMELLLTTADTKNENTYLIQFDRDAVTRRIDQLKGELGLTDTSLPFVTSCSPW